MSDRLRHCTTQRCNAALTRDQCAACVGSASYTKDVARRQVRRQHIHTVGATMPLKKLQGRPASCGVRHTNAIMLSHVGCASTHQQHQNIVLLPGQQGSSHLAMAPKRMLTQDTVRRNTPYDTQAIAPAQTRTQNKMQYSGSRLIEHTPRLVRYRYAQQQAKVAAHGTSTTSNQPITLNLMRRQRSTLKARQGRCMCSRCLLCCCGASHLHGDGVLATSEREPRPRCSHRGAAAVD